MSEAAVGGAAGRAPGAAGLTHREGRLRYWGFISYSRRDEQWARRLHHRLERFRVPRGVRSAEGPDRRWSARLRPIFRDDDELAASGDLGGRLREALDDAASIVVLCSPPAGRSAWVDAEMRHFIERSSPDRVVVVLIDGDPEIADQTGGRDAAFPPALASLEHEPAWVDARDRGRDRRHVVRIAAGILGTGFDNLWRRDRRRRRRAFALWSLSMIVVLAGFAGLLWREAKRAEERSPQNQVAAFESYVRSAIAASAGDADGAIDVDDVHMRLLGTDNLNHDSRLDFFVFNDTPAFCGSGGCSTEIYLSGPDGSYRVVLDLFGHTTPHSRETTIGSFKEILATRYMVDGREPIFSVYEWTGSRYDLSHLEYCDGVWIEYCDPHVIVPLTDGEQAGYEVADGAAILTRPAPDAPVAELQDSDLVIGHLMNRTWYLVHMWKGVSGFVPAEALRERDSQLPAG